MEIKRKKCKECGLEFVPYKTTDRHCSYICVSKNVSLNTPPPNTKSKAPINEEDFTSQACILRAKVADTLGRVMCEKCGSEHSIQFSTHHIIYRSEKPKHAQLNNLRNLIYLCFDCHVWFHTSKQNRNYIIQRRKLWELFGDIWGFDSKLSALD